MGGEIVHVPLGLITSPNEYGVYPPGAMSRARNVCMRAKGRLSAMPATRVYRSDIMSNGYTIRKLYAAGSSVLAIGDSSGNWQARWVTGSASTAIITTPTGLSAATFDTAQVNVAKARERYFITSLNDGVLALDSEGDTTVRAAGFRALTPAYENSTTTDAQCLADGTNAGWKFVWRRVHSDGYETAGEPSITIQYNNTSGLTTDPTWHVTFPTSAGIVAGDYIDVYRTKAVTTADPGDTFYLSSSVLLSGTDISNGYLNYRDRKTDAMLGEELYTNPGRPVSAIVGVSGDNTNTPPGLATDAWTFKGRTFYAIRRVPSFLKFRIGGNWGLLSSAIDRATGVGTRILSGNTTSGSNVITGVSAADLVGVQVGQLLTGSGWLLTQTTVTAVGATTITVSSNANATGAAALNTFDVLEINGIKGMAGFIGEVAGLGSFAALGFSQAFYGQPSQTAILSSSENLFSSGTSGITVILRQGRYGDGVLTVRGTNAQNYSPVIADISATATNGSYDERFNRLQWSKDSQPEAVPPGQELFYGNGAHYRGISTNDCTWLFASDGLWRKSGSGDTYRVDIVDPKLVLAGRNAVSEMGQRVYAYTERGFVRVSEGAGIEEIARPFIFNLLPGAAYADTWDTFVTCDELHREVWLSFRSGGSTTHYVYNEVSESFVDVIENEWSACTYAPYLRSLVIGQVDTAPDCRYFEDDSSTTRMTGADVRFQPFTGGDAFQQKEWGDCYYLFEGVTGAMTFVPRFGVTNYAGRTLSANSIESRLRVAIPRNAPALSPRITPGFSFSAGDTANAWSLLGISLSARDAGSQATR